MSLADPFGIFALGAGRAASRDKRNALRGILRQVRAARAQQPARDEHSGPLADLGWQAAYRSLWDEAPDTAADHDAAPARDAGLRFF